MSRLAGSIATSPRLPKIGNSARAGVNGAILAAHVEKY
jgi:hypothetical protein